MIDSEQNTNTLSKIANREKENSTPSTGKIIRLHKDYSDTELQSYLLEKVSRTFALTIPELPPELSHVVSNAYLLCRIVDTVEDEPALSASQKKIFCNRFIDVVGGKEDAKKFAQDLSPHLSDSTLDGEKELIALTNRVINITHSFEQLQQKAMERCVRIMADGMATYQQEASTHGLQNLKDLDNYCYYVAGVVGEMLTELFALYSPEIAKNKDKMMNLAVSFGQGLQMTNILKDVWEDYNRSACWLPRNYFNYNLDNLQHGRSTKNFKEGIEKLVGVAYYHLQDAMNYTLLIPSKEKGIRRFCYWAIGMAVLTLQKIHKNPGFTKGNQVKISRRSVKATILLTNLTVGSNLFLKMLFNASSLGLPAQKN